MDINTFFKKQNSKNQVKILTCGSVDDGKSTLIGRLLFDSKSIFQDQISQAEYESEKYGTQGKDIDLALLIDGLQAEREQGITIDVAYRYFETQKCKFIIADTPGHEEYTRNMATGASNSDVGIVLIDSTKGILDQTKRHTFILSLLGIRHIVIAINKMDLVNYDKDIFSKITKKFEIISTNFDFTSKDYIPMSALKGDNVFRVSKNMPWYKKETLINTLENLKLTKDNKNDNFCMPVQWVNRSTSDFRGYSGTVVSGSININDKIYITTSSEVAKINHIITPEGSMKNATNGQAVTLTLDKEIDISRGDLITSNLDNIKITDQFAAHIIWMNKDKMLPERNYIFRFTNSYITGKITDLVHKININSYEKIASKSLKLNDIGYCKIALSRKTFIQSYNDNNQLGSFVIIDQFNNLTVGAGVIDYELRRASNISWHEMSVDKVKRSKMNSQKPCVLWFTGLSGSGKSTIANILEQKLHDLNKRTYLLDGDNIRHGLNKDLGFTDEDRVENIRRVSEVAKLMTDAGLITLVSFISPFKSERKMARDLFENNEFVEIFVDTPLEECESRDPKGLYKKARSGILKNFTGIDSDYEVPSYPEIKLKTLSKNPEELANEVLDFLKVNNII